ncbi:MAG: creatininase family protein [Planctomycetaceae bacterium]
MQLFEMNWPQVKALAPQTPVVVPIAALEQHGPHMPVFTDSLLLGEVTKRVEQQLSDRVLFTPLMWLGNSEHHLDFAGTLTASPRTYITLLKEIAGNLITHGFRRILLLNGHGGNIVPSQQALFELRQEHRRRDDLRLFSATYWEAGPPPSDPSLVQTRMGHACEWETSMILHLHPHLVGDISRLEPITQDMPYAPAHEAWITQDRSTPGYIGDPAAATAEKGALLLNHFSGNVVALLERVFDVAE